MRVVLLQGPPRAGKDTAGEMLARGGSGELLLKFAAPIARYLRTMHDIHINGIHAGQKDQPMDVLRGRTPREVAIAYSEQLCKPLFGKDYFGRVAALTVAQAKASNSARVAVFTDSGFADEAEPVAELVGPKNMLAVRLQRAGTSFDNDSRSFWTSDAVGNYFDVSNNGTLDDLDRALDPVRIWILTGRLS